jgi:Na+-transporting methylmalonyl-CoA/oxaloacetate decarboxylase gamma subunit
MITALALLLGITMTVLFFLILFVRNDHKFTDELAKRFEDEKGSIDQRFAILERRKQVIAEAIASHPKPAGVGNVRMRTWNEDSESAE